MLKGGEFEKQDRNNLRVYKYDAGDNGEDQMNQLFEMCSSAQIKGRNPHLIYSGMKGNWIGHTLHRNCPVTHYIE